MSIRGADVGVWGLETLDKKDALVNSKNPEERETHSVDARAGEVVPTTKADARSTERAAQAERQGVVVFIRQNSDGGGGLMQEEEIEARDDWGHG